MVWGIKPYHEDGGVNRQSSQIVPEDSGLVVPLDWFFYISQTYSSNHCINWWPVAVWSHSGFPLGCTLPFSSTSTLPTLLFSISFCCRFFHPAEVTLVLSSWTSKSLGYHAIKPSWHSFGSCLSLLPCRSLLMSSNVFSECFAFSLYVTTSWYVTLWWSTFPPYAFLLIFVGLAVLLCCKT